MMSLSTRLKPVVDRLNRLSGWLLLLSVGWLAWTVARLLWLIVAPPTVPALPLQGLQNNAASMTDNSRLFAIFAEANPAMTAVQPPPNIVLKGVLLAVPEHFSSALLDINGVVKNYRINDSLLDSGYTLAAVDWNSIIITDTADRQTVISMADAMVLDQTGMNLANNRPSNTALSNNALSNTNAASTAATLPQSTPPDAASASAANQTGTTFDEAVTSLQQDSASYLTQMGVVASTEGYQVTAAMPLELRNRLGLAPEDRVLSVNGQKVGNNPGQDASILQQVQQSGDAQIEVQRGNQVIIIRQQF